MTGLIIISSRTKMFDSAQEKVFEEFLDGKHMFVTGPAGSGKSYLIQHMVENLKERQLEYGLTAMTGAAAHLISGQTLHSWGGIGLAKESAEKIVSQLSKPQRTKWRNRWKTTQVLIVDEISMMTASLFEKLEEIARMLRKSGRFFGGMQVVFFGDFCQLPPVALHRDKEQFAFESPLWASLRKHELQTIHRQQDPVFQRILNEVRLGLCGEDTVLLLQKQIGKKPTLPSHLLGLKPTRLYTTNAKVDEINEQELINLGEEVKRYLLHHQFEYLSDKKKMPEDQERDVATKVMEHAPLQEVVDVSIGAQVMCVMNIPDMGLVNGSRGIITGWNKENHPIVHWKEVGEIAMKPIRWEFPGEGWILSMEQVPLRLAWAVTIHKSQGMTLDYVEVDVGRTIFEYGQTYVALSRVKSLDGLHLVAFDPKRIKIHPMVQAYMMGKSVVTREEKKGTVKSMFHQQQQPSAPAPVTLPKVPNPSPPVDDDLAFLTGGK